MIATTSAISTHTARPPVARVDAVRTPSESDRAVDVADSILLERWRGGDIGGFHALMTRYERPVFRVIWKVVRNDEDARDLMQETFIRLWKNADKLREDTQLHPWLFRTASNLAIDHLRKYKPGREVSMVTQRDDGEDTVYEPVAQNADPRLRARRKEIENAIHAAVAELPKRQRVAMTLRSVEELSLKEIADILECEERTVGTTLFAARKKLIEKLRPLLEELKELAADPGPVME